MRLHRMASFVGKVTNFIIVEVSNSLFARIPHALEGVVNRSESAHFLVEVLSA
jgi:hypothetical protein